jgi:hypothetical protein
MNSQTSTKDSFSNRKHLAEAIIKYYALFDFVMEQQGTDSGEEMAKEYFRKKNIDDPLAANLLPLIQMKTVVLFMFPFVSYLHLLGSSELHVSDLPDDWNAILATGTKESRLTGSAKVVAIVRHSIAHLLEGTNSNHSPSNDSANGFQGVDFDKRSFHALIGSVEFKDMHGFNRFFTWVCKTTQNRAHEEKWS